MKPLRIYIDTNSLNDIAPKDRDWQETPLGSYLLEQSELENIEVWASPASVMEIALNKDLEQRNNMARALNTLIRGQRMMPPTEFQFMDDFLELIEHIWNSSTKSNRLEFLKSNSSRIYIALIGQLSALIDYDCSKGFLGIIAPKVATQIIHDEIFENPKAGLEKRINAIKNQNYSHLDYFNTLAKLDIDELEAKKNALRDKDYDIDKNVIKYLQKNIQVLINGYALDDLSFACDQTFVYWEDLAATIIDFKRIAIEWSTKSPKEQKENISIKPLQDEMVNRFESNMQTINDCRIILKEMVNRFHTQVRFPQISNYIIVKDLEKGLNKGKIPTGGVVLDSSHSISSLYCNILLSRDDRLNSSVDYWFKKIMKEEGLFRETVKNLNELKRSVKKGLSK
jgi:hypothetical protein